MIVHSRLRLLGIGLSFMVLMWMVVPSAIAVPPANDDFDSATTVTEPLPFTDAINTTEATTATDDPSCVGQGPTVWYVFTPTQDMRVEANTIGSDYDTTLSVYTGSRGNLTQIACNDDAVGLQSRVRFDAIAGQTVFFMVGAFDSGPGGNLVFTVDVAPPPLTIDLNIDSFGSVERVTGDATIRGTVTCSRRAFVDLTGELNQRAGRFDVIRGFFGTFFECNGVTPWTVTVRGDGPFNAGPAKVSAFASAFDPEGGESTSDTASTVVQLRGR